MFKVALSASSSQFALLLFTFDDNALVDNVGQTVSKFVLVGLIAAAQIIVVVADDFLGRRGGENKRRV